MADNQYVTGIDAAVDSFNKKLKKVGAYTEKSMQEVVKDLRQKATDLAPVDTGDLRGSAQDEVTVGGTSIVGEVSFNTPYARRQHEEMSYRHTDGQAKYLEEPFKKNSQKYIQHLADSVKKAVE